MKRSKIGLVLITSLILNTTLLLQPIGVSQVEAAFPGYNGKIAFTSDYYPFHIDTVMPDGSGRTNVISGPSNGYIYYWSPDGSKFTFTQGGFGDIDIYVINADGSNQIRLTNSAGANFWPKWSPDGNKIVFSSNRDGNWEVYVMNADGSDQDRLTNASGEDSNAQWSPDGNQIAFQSLRDGNWEIYVMDDNGSNQTRLTNHPVNDFRFRWSSDGSKLMFVSSRDGHEEIYSMNADGSDQTRLTNLASWPIKDYLDVSPDSSKIAAVIADEDYATTRLLIMDANGTNQQIFDYSSQGAVIIDWIGWSPDGSKLHLTAYDAGWNNWDSYVVNADGSGLTRLTNDGVSGYGDWQPIPNTPPVLASKTASLTSGSSTLVDVLSGSTDEEVLSGSNITIDTSPSHGSAVVESGKIKYTADADYAGTDSLVYEVCDSFTLDQQCSTKTLNLTVKPSLGLAKIGTTQTTGSTKVETTNTKPTFSGTTTPLAQVTVEIHSDPIILTTTADSSGSWSVTPDSPLPTGDHTVYISSTLNGQTTELNSFVLGISQQLPNAGVSYTLWRYLGLVMAIIGGLSLVYAVRRRTIPVPRLFP